MMENTVINQNDIISIPFLSTCLVNWLIVGVHVGNVCVLPTFADLHKANNDDEAQGE